MDIGELKRIFLFNSLSESELEKLLGITTMKSCQKGNILFYEGDEAKKLYILIDGIIKAYKSDMKQNQIVIHYFYPISIVAEMANFHKIPFPATAELETSGSVLEIDYEIFERDFLKDTAIAFKIIQSLSQKLKYLENVITTHLTLDSTSRVAKFLYENQNSSRNIKQNKIATILGITPETLSRTMKKFRTLGLISDEGKKFQILNSDGLLELFS